MFRHRSVKEIDVPSQRNAQDLKHGKLIGAGTGGKIRDSVEERLRIGVKE